MNTQKVMHLRTRMGAGSGSRRGVAGEPACVLCWEEDCGGCALLSPLAGRCSLCGEPVARDSFYGWCGGGPCHWECLEALPQGRIREDGGAEIPREDRRKGGTAMEQVQRKRTKRTYPGRRPPAPRPGGQKGRTTRRSRGGMAALSALSREARRRRMTYGALCQVLTEEEREEVVRAWQAEHPAPVRGCGGCVYWRDCSATSPEMGRMCHFALENGRMRRRDGGRCLEYRREPGKPAGPGEDI